VGQMIGVKS
jgi:hypothetical protein